MTLKSIVCSVFTGLCFFVAQAQSSSEELVKINNKSYTVADFERVYTKNLDLIKDPEQKKIDTYMDMFVLYKLKLEKAYALQLDQNEAYKSELASNRNQLAQKYFTDEKKLHALAEEAYKRSLTEREASHILFRVGQFASSADTLQAYQKAMKVYEEINNGLPFDQAAVRYSDDQSAQQNKGYLGYFSVFRMVYPFETGAYNTAVGAVSLPVRSSFGYHLIHVTNERPVRYFRNISQIYIRNTKDQPNTNAQKEINDVYAQLQSGTSFDALMEKYPSDDFMGANHGKTIGFYPGMLNIPGLDDQVYQLNQVGDYSAPFESPYGWHIVKIDSIEPFPSFEENEPALIQRISTDSRSQIMQKDLENHLKTRFNFSENNQEKKKVFAQVNDHIYTDEWKAPNYKGGKNTLFSYGDQKVTSKDFLDYTEKNYVRYLNIQPKQDLLQILLNQMVSRKLSQYYDDRLEIDFPEFKNTVQEYREGLLLFDLMEKDIWEASRKDSLGYTTYYAENWSKYATKDQFKGVIATYSKEKQAKKALKMFAKKAPIARIVAAHQPLVWQEGVFLNDDPRWSDLDVVHHAKSRIVATPQGYVVLMIEEVQPSKKADWMDVKSRVYQDYQEVYEKKWTENLLKQAAVEINQKALNELKAKYSQN